MTYEERLAEVKKAEQLLRIAQCELTKALNKGDFKALKKARRDCLLYRRAVIGIAEAAEANGTPIDKRLYKL